MNKKLDNLTLKELRFIKDNYSKMVTMNELINAINELSDKLELSKEDAFEAFKLGTYNVIDMYIRG